MLFMFICYQQLIVSGLFSVIICLFLFFIIIITTYYYIKELIYMDLELWNIR